MRNTKNTIGKGIPLTDLSCQYRSLKKEIDSALKKVLQSGRYILGPEVSSFEEELAKFLGVRYALGVSSGTDALTIAVKSLGLGKKDEVLIPANVYPVAFGVALSGFAIRLSDVEEGSLNLSLEEIKSYLTPKTRAVVIVHLYGNPVELSPIMEFAKKKGIFVIEDCAHAAGAEYKGRKLGTIGDIGCFSFYPTKNLAALGDGGMVVTSDSNIARKARLLRMYGEKARYQSVLVGHNSRLGELQAAVLRVKLRYLNALNRKRISSANLYLKLLKGLPAVAIVPSQHGSHVYHQFVIKVKDRRKLEKYLSRKNIVTGIHYPVPVHLTKSFSFLGYKKGDFPVSEGASEEVLSLPIYPGIKRSSLIFVAKAIREFYKRK